MEPLSLRHALSRGLFHAAVGLAIATALFFFPWLVTVGLLILATVVLLCLEAARLRLPSLKQRCSVWLSTLLRKEEESTFTGASYFLLGSLVTVLAFPKGIAFLAILFLTLGDPAASIIGTWKGRIKLKNKSIEGDLACLVVCLMVGILVSTVLGMPPLVVALVGALIATLFESLPLRLNDNITIPFASALTMLLSNILAV